MLLVCYVLLYVVALCVKMRYAILSIKRLLIEMCLRTDTQTDGQTRSSQCSERLYRGRRNSQGLVDCAGDLTSIGNESVPKIIINDKIKFIF